MNKRVFDPVEALFHTIETRVDIFLGRELFVGVRFHSYSASLPALGAIFVVSPINECQL